LRELVLFGSQARGDAAEESDADVLVVVDDLTEAERREVLDLSWYAGAAGDEYVSIAPLAYSTAQVGDLRARERRLMREIARDGLVL
jgi:predicted nucleotidyltransferase